MTDNIVVQYQLQAVADDFARAIKTLLNDLGYINRALFKGF